MEKIYQPKTNERRNDSGASLMSWLHADTGNPPKPTAGTPAKVICVPQQ